MSRLKKISNGIQLQCRTSDNIKNTECSIKYSHTDLRNIKNNTNAQVSKLRHNTAQSCDTEYTVIYYL